jgi:hypothetical protein
LPDNEAATVIRFQQHRRTLANQVTQNDGQELFGEQQSPDQMTKDNLIIALISA